MSTQLRRSDPALYDSLCQHGGQAASRGVNGPRKRYWKGMGISPSRGSRHLNGDPHSPAARYLIELADAGVNTFPLAVEGLTLAIQRDVEPLRAPDIEREIQKLDEEEHALDADEDRQVLRAVANPSPEQLEECALADVKLAELVTRRAALRRRLARLKRKGLA